MPGAMSRLVIALTPGIGKRRLRTAAYRRPPMPPDGPIPGGGPKMRTGGRARRLTRAMLWPLVAAALFAGAGPAGAYYTGPHADITEDAMTAEGFGPNAVGVAQVNNWFVDFYENDGPRTRSPATPTSRPGSAPGTLLTESWSDELVEAAERGHFDSSTPGAGQHRRYDPRVGPAAAGRPGPCRARRCASARTRLQLLAVLGISLHQVQDFYTHTNWIEPQSAAGAEVPLGSDGPGWQARGFGSSPTWFDVPAAEREQRRRSMPPRRRQGTRRTARRVGRQRRGRRRRREHDPVGDDGEGLARSAALPAVGHRRLLRHAPVGAGRPLVGRRRGLLGPRPALLRSTCANCATTTSAPSGSRSTAGRWQGQGDPPFGDAAGARRQPPQPARGRSGATSSGASSPSCCAGAPSSAAASRT